MMNKTDIEYLDYTWNPMHGCSHSGMPGCDNCWAKVMSKRLAGMGVKGYSKDEPFKVVCCPEKLEEPLKEKKPSRIGVSFMGDLFHKDVPVLFIDRIFSTMVRCFQNCIEHKFIVLTKRPNNMKRYFDDLKNSQDDGCGSISDILNNNIWLGISVSTQKDANELIPILLQVPAKVRVVSVEPMLENIDLQYVSVTECMSNPNFNTSRGLDGVFCGCESGANRRKCDIQNFRNLKNQCVEDGIPFFLKQMEINGKIVHMPELDGRIWNQYPKK